MSIKYLFHFTQSQSARQRPRQMSAYELKCLMMLIFYQQSVHAEVSLRPSACRVSFAIKLTDNCTRSVLCKQIIIVSRSTDFWDILIYIELVIMPILWHFDLRDWLSDT